MPNKHFARQTTIDVVVAYRTVGDNGDPIDHHPLSGHSGAVAFGPIRIGSMYFSQRAGGMFNPSRLNSSYLTGPQSGGFHQLCGHYEVVTFFEQTLSVEDSKVVASGSMITLAALIPRSTL